MLPRNTFFPPQFGVTHSRGLLIKERNQPYFSIKSVTQVLHKSQLCPSFTSISSLHCEQNVCLSALICKELIFLTNLTIITSNHTCHSGIGFHRPQMLAKCPERAPRPMLFLRSPLSWSELVSHPHGVSNRSCPWLIPDRTLSRAQDKCIWLQIRGYFSICYMGNRAWYNLYLSVIKRWIIQLWVQSCKVLPA